MRDSGIDARAMVDRALAAQRAVDKLAVLHGFTRAPGDAVCGCPVMPVNHIYAGREQVAAWPLAAPDGTAARDAAADGDWFNASGADSWVIACPACRRLYAAGTELDPAVAP